MCESPVVTVCADASSIRGWGASLGDHFLQGKWSKLERREGINWKELRVLNRALETWRPLLAGKLALARMDNGAAASYANYGAGRVSQLTVLAREIKEREVARGRTLVALRIAGKDNSAADASSRFSIRARGLGPYPDRELRWRFRQVSQRCCGAVDVDMLASDDGRNAWVPDFRPPSNSAVEGPFPPWPVLAVSEDRNGGTGPCPHCCVYARRVARNAPGACPAGPLETLAPGVGPV